MTTADLVLIDVAGTMLHKPRIVDAFQTALRASGVEMPDREFLRIHKIASEATLFPMVTTCAFYRVFNAEVLSACGVHATEALLDQLEEGCRYLPWEAYPDVGALGALSAKLIVVSNWDMKLRDHLAAHVSLPFVRIVGSAEAGVAKPDPEIYLRAVQGLGVSPDRVVHIGDSIDLDVLPARQAGFRAVLLDRYDAFPDFSGDRVDTFESFASLIGGA